MSEEPRKPRPKWMDDNHSQARKANAHERRIAGKMGGKRLPRSGGRPWSKWTKNVTDNGDISTPDVFIEHKHTTRLTLGLKREWLDKVKIGARQHMRVPAIVVTFDTAPAPPEDWILVPLGYFEQLLEKAKKDE